MGILANRIAGGLLVAASIAYFVPTFGFAPPPATSTDPGMAIWPQALSVIGILAALALIVLPERVGGDLAQITDHGPDEEPEHFGPAILGIGLTIFYIASLKAQLYFWTTPLFVAGLLWICGARNPWLIIGVALGTEAVAYFLFFRLLGVPLLNV